MHHLAANQSCNVAMSEAELARDGHTVSSRGRCLARIGEQFVMRDSAHRCVRVQVANTDASVLGAIWADFCRPSSGKKDLPDASESPWRGTILPKDASLVLQGYTTITRGACLARVAGHYVARDGVRRCIRFLVDAVDPVKLGTAWAAFSDAAGWVRAASGVSAETLNDPVGTWTDIDEERSTFS